MALLNINANVIGANKGALLNQDLDFLLDENGDFLLDENGLKIYNASKKYGADINMFIQYGQSLSQGDWESHIASAIQKYNSLMFTGGVRVWENRNQATIYDALVPAIETAFSYIEGETPVGATYRGETPACGSADLIHELMISEDGIGSYLVLVSAPGLGGQNIATLSNTSGVYYQRLIRDVVNGKRLANLAGKSFSCPAVSWIQGETDYWVPMSRIDYYNAMVALFNNLNTDIRAITGQSENVNFFLYQTHVFDTYGGYHYPEVSLAQLQISLDRNDVHLVSPIYHLPKIADNTHFTAAGSKLFGGYCGLAYKRVVIDQVGWNPIHLLTSNIVGNDIFLKFYAPSLPLTFDTVNVKDRGVSKGFQIRGVSDKNQNSFIDIITNATLTAPDTIKISCSSSPAGKKLTYAINGVGGSDLSNGNLRDSQSIKFSFKNISTDTDETIHDMYNWCPHFETIL